jgi:hypothetical protein
VFKRELISEEWDIKLFLVKRYKVLSIENLVILYKCLNTSVTHQLEDDNNQYKLV